MHQIWDALVSVGDGFGRSRSASFMTLPKRDVHPDYYDAIEEPISFGLIRKRIVKCGSGKGSYRDLDEFEEAVTLLIENARAYYKDVDDVLYADAEVLQDIFWQAFQAIETDPHAEYKVEPVGKKAKKGMVRSRGFAGLELASDDEDEMEKKSAGSRKKRNRGGGVRWRL